MTLDRKLTYCAYALFVVAILAAPVFFDEFGLNRIAKFLVYGMLGVAVALSWEIGRAHV